MVLDCNNGNIILGELIIRPHMSFSNFKKNISQDKILSCEITNSVNLLIKPLKYDNKFFIMRLYFDICDEKLMLCHMIVQDNDDISSWETWSREKELKKKEKNDIWLLNETNRINFSYKWGRVRSIYNELEGSSYIVFEYD